MGIERLCKAVVVAPAAQSRTLVNELLKFGEFHPHTSDEDRLAKDLEPLYSRVRKLYLELEALARSINASSGTGVLRVLLEGEPEPRVLSFRNVVEVVEKLEGEASALLNRYNLLSNELASVNAEAERLERERAELSLKASTGIDLKQLTGLRYFYAALFIGMRRDLAEIRASLDNVSVVSRELDRSQVLILVIAPRTEEEKIEKTIRSFNLVRIQAIEGEDMEGLLKKKREVEEKLLALRDKLESIRAEMETFRARHGEEVAGLRDLAAKLLDIFQRARGEAGRVVVLEGYIPSKTREEFISRVGGMAYIHISEVEEGGHHAESQEQPPTLLKNNPLTESFRPITLIQGPPSYYEIDPTPFVSIFLSIFYGIMFADLGQGLVLAALGLVLSLRARGGLRLWGKLLTILGVSSAVGGLLIQEAFGFKLSPLTGIKPILELVEHHGESVALNPSAVLTLFTFAPLLGILHVSIGLALSAYILLKNGEIGEALFSKIASLAMYIFGVLFGIAFIGAGGFDRLLTSTEPAPLLGVPLNLVGAAGVYGLAASLALIVGGRVIGPLVGLMPKSSLLSGVGTGLLEILENIIHFMSNTLSYLRISILMIIHIALMLLINAAWEAMGPASIGILIIGNIGVMGLEGLLVFIQSLRLHLYEFFSKFYTGEGTVFKPLTLESERFRVVLTD